MSFATIDDLRESLAQPPQKMRRPEYVAKMMHAVPDATVVDRKAFILERCAGQRVLEFGATGKLSDEIRAVASAYAGVDRADAGTDVRGFNLDNVNLGKWPGYDGSRPDVVVCGEVIEHLANPGYFVERLHGFYPGVPVIISTPNAFCRAAAVHMQDGIENVNLDHVCWYSYTTLKTLLTRYGYTIEAFHWYNGEPLTAEGMLMVLR